MRDLVARFSRKLGREIRLAGVPRWMVKAIAVFVPLAREVDEAAAATVAWARQHYATT